VVVNAGVVVGASELQLNVIDPVVPRTTVFGVGLVFGLQFGVSWDPTGTAGCVCPIRIAADTTPPASTAASRLTTSRCLLNPTFLPSKDPWGDRVRGQR
jgi:hypothetical protein